MRLFSGDDANAPASILNVRLISILMGTLNRLVHFASADTVTTALQIRRPRPHFGLHLCANPLLWRGTKRN